jgi:hypothetical protein
MPLSRLSPRRFSSPVHARWLPLRVVIERPEPAALAGRKRLTRSTSSPLVSAAEPADAPIVLRLKSHGLRRECAGEEALSRCEQEAPTEHTASLKLRCP